MDLSSGLPKGFDTIHQFLHNDLVRLHRFFIGHNLKPDRNIEITDAELVHQLTNVMRMTTGDRLILLDGNGHEADAEITDATWKKITVKTGELRTINAEPARQVTLCCALLKRENFEWVVQKATECGVARIIPLLTARTVKTNLNLERLRRIATEAMEQSGRGTLPVIDEPMTPEQALTSGASPAHVFFHLDGQTGWQSRINDTASVTVWIGPEGGWTEEETAWAKAQGFLIGSLGPLVLRGETAAVIATYLAWQ